MTLAPSDPWLELIHALRAQTGITPIPLSEAERRSGMVAAFAAAVAPVGPEAPTVPAKQRREVSTEEARRPMVEHPRPVATEHNPPRRETERPVETTLAPVEPSPPSKRMAMGLAAYRKTSR
ncbi:MAG: hypothetical protein HQL87_09080 [Magnetococcales bacterium]|nr:hypothetical protein [Magnetococcales bacterium]